MKPAGTGVRARHATGILPSFPLKREGKGESRLPKTGLKRTPQKGRHQGSTLSLLGL